MAELQSGLWSGHYVHFGRNHPQQMTLEFADGLIRGDGVDGLGTFTIEGEYRIEDGEVRLGWMKTYDGAHTVLYLGRLEQGVVHGRWTLPGDSGGFALSATLDRAAAAGAVTRAPS